MRHPRSSWTLVLLQPVFQRRLSQWFSQLEVQLQQMKTSLIVQLGLGGNGLSRVQTVSLFTLHSSLFLPVQDLQGDL